MSDPSGPHGDELERRRRVAKAAREWSKEAHPFDRSLPLPQEEVINDETASDVVLIAFPGAADKLGVPAVDFFEPIRDWHVRRVYVRRLAPMVAYPHSLGTSVAEIAGSLRSIVAGHRRAVFMGTSIGGFHALLFGTLVGADAVLGLFPITSMLPAVLEDASDDRWAATLEQTPTKWLDDFGDMPRLWDRHQAPTVVIHYPEAVHQYAVQARHVESRPNVRLVPRHEEDTGHALSHDPRIYDDLAHMLWPGADGPRLRR